MELAASAGSMIWGRQKGNSCRSSNSSLTRFTNSSQLYQNVDKTNDSSVPKSCYHEDDDSKELQTSENEPFTKKYQRRFYILFLFSVMVFMHFCCWNSFGPIFSTCVAVFDWTVWEIAFISSLDPLCYIVAMPIFYWLMHVKGLRLSIVVSAFFMALGTGIRCMTSDKRYVTISMAIGQFFNGLAGPVAQAAPAMLAANWFPMNERITATAVVSLLSAFGVAISFIIGPAVVREVDGTKQMFNDPFYNITRIQGFEKKCNPYTRISADSIYSEAKYYWPFDNEDSFSFDDKHDDDFIPNSIIFQEYKNNYHGRVVGKILKTRGVFIDGVTTRAKKGWINLGNFENECLGKPSLCREGLSVAFWVKFSDNTTKQFLLGTGGLKSQRNGFLVSTKRSVDSKSYMKVDVVERSNIWRVYFSALSDSWNHVAFTWNRNEGLSVYLNSTLVAKKIISSTLQYIGIRGKSFTVGRVNNAKRYSSASFDEIGLWEKILKAEEVNKIFQNGLQVETSVENKALLDEYYKIKEESKKDIMKLMYAEFAVNGILFILLLLYFPDKPPKPPSKSISCERPDFLGGINQLVENPSSFWTFCIIHGITTGVYCGWGVLLNVNLSYFGIPQQEIGWIGFYTVLGGISAGMILGRCTDLVTGRMKMLLLLLFAGATCCFLWFCLICQSIVSFRKDSLFKATILGGFFISGTIPLTYELAVMQMYPIGDGTTIGIMMLVNKIATVLFLAVFLIPNIGTFWMNWALFGSCAICLPALVAFKGKFNRSHSDLQ